VASSEYVIGRIEDRNVKERDLEVISGPLVVIGRNTFAPTNVIGTWACTRHTDWVLISIAVKGDRIIRDEDGTPVRHPDITTTHRYEKVEFAPRWIVSAAKSSKPPRPEVK